MMHAFLIVAALLAPQDPAARDIVPCPECRPLTEPPCSYVITQDAKGLIEPTDPVVAWLRGRHNGGAAPIRHFLSGPRVINDTYGLFFYDPEAGYVAAYEKDYGYAFHGWRGGVMVVRHEDGTLFSALTGAAISGPRAGQRLTRVPSLTTTWEQWKLLHPESTAYDLFDGERYPIVELPTEPAAGSIASRGETDDRLPAEAGVLGVRVGDARMAFPLDGLPDRAVLQDTVGGWTVVVFWQGRTGTATAYRAVTGGTRLRFEPDPIAPRTAPFRDVNTRTRWSIAGRGIDGLLRGEELTWVDSIQCKWFAWAAEHPDTSVHELAPPAGNGR
jgi:hypothetical protein